MQPKPTYELHSRELKRLASPVINAKLNAINGHTPLICCKVSVSGGAGILSKNSVKLVGLLEILIEDTLFSPFKAKISIVF